MKKSTLFLFLGIFMFGTHTLFAAETPKKQCAGTQILKLEGRGLINFVTSPGEFVSTFTREKKNHPKAWPATYIPRVFGNIVTRVTSGVNDMFILPFYVWASHDTTPMTRRFELPDYVWQNE